MPDRAMNLSATYDRLIYGNQFKSARGLPRYGFLTNPPSTTPQNKTGQNKAVPSEQDTKPLKSLPLHDVGLGARTASAKTSINHLYWIIFIQKPNLKSG